jgi:hypothetical protein
MSKNLYCPKCDVEYWGPSFNAICGSCKYFFSKKDKRLAMGMSEEEYKEFEDHWKKKGEKV